MPAWITPELWPLWWLANSASFSTKAMVNSKSVILRCLFTDIVHTKLTLKDALFLAWVSERELLGGGQTDDPAADDDDVERGVAAAARSGCVPRPTIPVVTGSVGQSSKEDLPSLECSGARMMTED